MDILQSFFRWFHVVAGILWIGHLYFFNWVNGPFAATLDAETKKKVVPELMPRALFWFRWGAAWTWATGVLLLMLVFYHGGLLFDDPSQGWNKGALLCIALTLLSPFIYEGFQKCPKTKPAKNPKSAAIWGIGFVALFLFLMTKCGFSYRAYNIHVGAAFGTIMAFNVWFRIWPSQQKIITAIKNGEKPDADVVALAGMRSKHNTYMSVPLIWTMISAHTTWASSSWLILVGVIAFAWIGTQHLYKKAAKVKGF